MHGGSHMMPIKCWLTLLGMALFIINTNATAFAAELGMTNPGGRPVGNTVASRNSSGYPLGSLGN